MFVFLCLIKLQLYFTLSCSRKLGEGFENFEE